MLIYAITRTDIILHQSENLMTTIITKRGFDKVLIRSHNDCFFCNQIYKISLTSTIIIKQRSISKLEHVPFRVPLQTHSKSLLNTLLKTPILFSVLGQVLHLSQSILRQTLGALKYFFLLVIKGIYIIFVMLRKRTLLNARAHGAP